MSDAADPALPLCCLAFDFGAGSGRAMLATLRNDWLDLEELLRFPGLETGGPEGPHWDAPRLFSNLEAGLAAAAAQAATRGLRVASIGVDGWGLDYGLVGPEGRLLAAPVHYRHPRSQRGLDASPLPLDRIARITEGQILAGNTLFQLIAERSDRPDLLGRAERLLMIAELASHHLTGCAVNELTLARTSGLHDRRLDRWSDEILDATGLPRRLFGPIAQPGSLLGPLRPALAAASGLGPVPVVTVAGHDTASAVYALPLGPTEAFMIAGSWNVVGFECAATAVPAEALTAGFGVEGGATGRALVTRSLPGLLLMRRLQAGLASPGGARPDFPSMAAAARAALEKGLPVALDPSDPALLASADMQAAAFGQMQAAGHTPAGTDAELILALYLGLVEQAAAALGTAARLAGEPWRALRLGGGGAQDGFLCSLLASRLGVPVLAGPVEASAAGNALFQLIGLGRVDSLPNARRFIANSGMTREYPPDADLERLLKGAPCSP
ncbi:rhamnulokinase family protein [Rhodobacter sp. CZR27]|uniref:rhamnulokinase n=1 Tax=Rhodobacter sp. CZR27 TaxID=2033869 RepID=UPI000BBE941F|nr:FGGY family carbohydrate kinase [Rhodobacter sp. CZR27]